jgi:hypothetical protein
MKGRPILNSADNEFTGSALLRGTGGGSYGAIGRYARIMLAMWTRVISVHLER